MKPTRAQLEIGLLVAGTLAILIMYRNYLQRALALQEQRQSDLASVLADARSGPPASTYQNGGGVPRFDPDLARRAAEQPPHADA